MTQSKPAFNDRSHRHMADTALSVIAELTDSRGICAATARLAADQGYALCLNYQRQQAAAQTLVKDSGRNCIHLFRNTMQKATSERLRLAVARGEFELYFQPQVDERNNKIIGAEALLHWIHPTLGTQSPALFIHVLEESGLHPSATI